MHTETNPPDEGSTLPRRTDPPPGVGVGLRIGHYELIRVVGRGGMGVVYAARDTKLGRRVAIKFLNSRSRDISNRVQIEARATAQCTHENIVVIHEVAEYQDIPFMVLEYLDGQTLRDVIGPFGSGLRTRWSRVVELLLPVACALTRAHELGIVHRDLKPENVFLTVSGQIKVLDFGIARALDDALRTLDVGDLDRDPRKSALAGTLPYMAPEQITRGDVDHRCDIWALGIVMFEMLAGRHPLELLTAESLIASATSTTPMPSIRGAVPDLPDAVVAIVDGCLRKSKLDRIARATELVERLEQLVPGRRSRHLAEGENPYPGLTAFQEADADRFFGRSREVARAIARIRELPICGVVGASGIGKSSFIAAGVGPALKASGERWDIATLRPGRHPLAALASLALRLTTSERRSEPANAGERGPRRSEPANAGERGPTTRLGEHNELVERLRNEPGYIGTVFRERARQIDGQVLLVIDQFEELYTLVPDAGERRAFTSALAAVADDSAAPLRVVVSMRSDFLDRVAEDSRLLEELSRGLVFLSSPDRSSLREALVGPIELVGYRFETEAMIDKMLNELSTTSGALPLLQFAAAKLWAARDRERRLLTEASYLAVGGIAGALAMHADDVVTQMNAAGQKLARLILRTLVTPERTRAIGELDDVYHLGPDRAEVARTIDRLVAGRLLVVQTRGDTGSSSVELVHESLIERWPMLHRWLEEDHDDAIFVAQLANAAKQWHGKGRAAGLLWRGEAATEAIRWDALRRVREVATREREFLDAVMALARRGKRAKRIAMVSAFVLLATVAAGASAAFLWIRGAEYEASENAARAERESAKARDTLVEMQQAERNRLAAEQEKQAAVHKQAAAEAEVEEKSAQVKDGRAQLEVNNVKLQAALEEGTQARTKAESERALAEAARTKAQQAAADLEKAKRALEEINAKQVAEIERLRELAKKVTTKLK